MKKKTANMIRMMAFEGKSLRQIAAKTNLNVEEIEDYLLAQGIPPTYTVKQQREEKKMNESMNEMRILGKPINQTQTDGRAKLTAEQKQELLHKLECGVGVSQLAKDYGLTNSYVYKIRRKMTTSTAPEAAEETQEQTEEKPALSEDKPEKAASTVPEIAEETQEQTEEMPAMSEDKPEKAADMLDDVISAIATVSALIGAGITDIYAREGYTCAEFVRDGNKYTLSMENEKK